VTFVLVHRVQINILLAYVHTKVIINAMLELETALK